MTTATLRKWGNSSAVRIPNHIVKRLNLEEGAEIELIVTPENDLLLRPMKKNARIERGVARSFEIASVKN